MRRRDERGSATLWAVTWTMLLVLLAHLAALVAGVVARQHQLDAAADLAALSGAARVQRGLPGCAAAAETVSASQVELSRCQTQGEDIVVEVTSTVALPFGIEVTLRGAARAGP